MPAEKAHGGIVAAAGRREEARLAWWLVVPALVPLVGLALLPVGWAVLESLHLHDLRAPWLGEPFVGLRQYREALGDPRFLAALAHTLFFTAASVTLELGLGFALALALHARFPGRGLARMAALLPWALPTVVAALVWRFLFDGPASFANQLALALGASEPIAWLSHPQLAWVPVILADVWKTTPFVALLLLAGLQSIDPALDEAARVDGAGSWRRLWHVTLPLLRPALAVVLLFRAVDALRLFDLVYVLTGGGPGTATEPLALYTFTVLLQYLRFGYGAALAVIIFVLAAALAWGVVRSLAPSALGGRA
ncbi:MAG: sugar ABC transporter permease [Myxococcota bacterium]